MAFARCRQGVTCQSSRDWEVESWERMSADCYRTVMLGRSAQVRKLSVDVDVTGRLPFAVGSRQGIVQCRKEQSY